MGDAQRTSLLVQADLMIQALNNDAFSLENQYPDGSIGAALQGLFRKTHDMETFRFAEFRARLKEGLAPWAAINFVLGEKNSNRLIK